jgi:hypothetical protein
MRALAPDRVRARLQSCRNSYKITAGFSPCGLLFEAALLAALPASAQYSGKVTKDSKDSPELRAIAVVEWIGDAGKPKFSRLVPVAVLDGGQLQDGGIYMARPEPLALAGEVEYELEQDGKPVGLFDIRNSAREQGSWVGYGAWKPMPAPRRGPTAQELARTRIDDDVQSDEPVLHRKHHADDPPSGSASGSSGQAQSSDASPSDTTSDPDRPTLHKKSSSDSAGDASTSTTGTNTGSTSTSQTSNPDGPVLHKRDSSDSADSASGTSDPDRPVLKKNKKKQEDIGDVESLPDASDPDRPRLRRGKSSGGGLDIVPSLLGFPPDLQQAVAVSDARPIPAHSWTYSWSSPDDEAKMKLAMEDIARNALGLNSPPATTAPKRTSTKTGTQSKAKKKAQPAPTPAPLIDEEFRVFELAYGSGATMVLSARTDGPAAEQKFVTLVAQPDLYGNALVLLKNVTDGAHLDETPRMRLVDAVDAMADNRGELLFELRGATQRQFALYRVLRGQAEKLFVSGGGEFSEEAEN